MYLYQNELMITFIELIEEMKRKKLIPIFFNPVMKMLKINEPMTLFQYPKEEFSMDHGIIISTHSFNFHHNVYTNHGSAGTPLLNKNYQVMGVHKSRLPNKKGK